MADRILKAGFLPDTFSTDWTQEARTSQVINFPNVMSKFLLLGMRMEQVIACATLHPSRAFPVFHNQGTLKVGAPANIAVLELKDGSFEFEDNFQGKRSGQKRLFPFATVLEGKQTSAHA
jgi:dihydroorotase